MARMTSRSITVSRKVIHRGLGHHLHQRQQDECHDDGTAGHQSQPEKRVGPAPAEPASTAGLRSVENRPARLLTRLHQFGKVAGQDGQPRSGWATRQGTNGGCPISFEDFQPAFGGSSMYSRKLRPRRDWGHF
jgi:hypothetical protein